MNLPVSNGNKIVLLSSSLNIGGIQRVMTNLANEFVRRGLDIYLILSNGKGPFEALLDPRIHTFDLAVSNTYAGIPGFARLLRRIQPDAILSAHPNINIAAICARAASGVKSTLVISEHSTISLAKKSSRRLSVRLRPLLERVFYPIADNIVAVSNGVAEDMAQETGISRQRIRVIYNPIVIPEILAQAQIPPSHPWLSKKNRPVILAVGSLRTAKDYPTLIAAFSHVRKLRSARLIILGEGEQRPHLEALITSLELNDDVSLPGFEINPFSYMSHSDVLALSSLWEGLPTVLLEALACSTPIVSTACPSGPAEILAGGKYGRLVSVRNDEMLATAIVETLDAPISKALLKERALDFSIPGIANQYLETLFPGNRDETLKWLV